MKKEIKYLPIIIMGVLFFSCLIPIVKAEEIKTGRISSTTGLKLRSDAGTSYSEIILIPHNSIVNILSSKTATGCNDPWMQIEYKTSSTTYTGYACSTYIEIQNTSPPVEEKPTDSEMANMTDEEFESYLNSQGFNESYKVKLRALHKLHPTWIFKGVKSKYTWSQALNEQNDVGRSLYSVNETAKKNGYEGYLSTASGNYDYETDTFEAHDGIYWFQANNETISYYMDPRNFLSESSIFMFEDLLYQEKFHTLDSINKILTSDFMRNFSPYFLEAGKKYSVSPMYLAALSRQEVGLSSTNIVTNGKAGILSDGVNYTGYYNFFNIGASSSDNPKLKSLQSAKANEWNTEQKSILAGSYKITVNYIQCGQYTSYYQKFNLAPTATKGIWHQYTTNVAALESPANTTFNSYKSMGIINEEFVFSIPIFDGMPTKTSLPPKGNPNNWLQSLKINNISVSNFSGEKTSYTITIPYAESINLTATTVNTNSTIKGIGTIALKDKTTTTTITVTAQNGKTKNYKLIINREDKVIPPDENIPPITIDEILNTTTLKHDKTYIWNIALTTNVDKLTQKITDKYKQASVNIKDRSDKNKISGTIATGDKVTISYLTEEKTYQVIIYGDISGDGFITTSDLLQIQKHILGKTTLVGAALKAGDVNKDGKVNTRDLLLVQKSILKYSNISQS